MCLLRQAGEKAGVLGSGILNEMNKTGGNQINFNTGITIRLPDHVKTIISVLEDAGHEAYAVGGCVRDALLGREPDDWDITTSALPEQVKRLFPRTIDTGLQHGTVTVLFPGPELQSQSAACPPDPAQDADAHKKQTWFTYEVTTFRVDGVYEDGRHPKEVAFTPSLKEDLKRRDFTINAMAYNERTGLADCFCGLQDLRDGKIRCVGVAKNRFTEDALRMMRAIRFAAQLGFEIVPDTGNQIKALAPRLAMISAERIQTELVKLLVSPHPDRMELFYTCGLTDVFLPEFSALMRTPQNNKHHGETAGAHTIASLNRIRPDRVLRLAMLFHDIAKPLCRTTDEDGADHFYGHPQAGAKLTREILRRLKFDNDTIRRVAALVGCHDERPPLELRAVRRAVSRNQADIYPDLFAVMRADILAQSGWMRQEKLARVDGYERLWREISAKKQCLSVKDLAVDGKDLIEAGIPSGPEIGHILNAMLDHVLEEPQDNQRGYLLMHLQAFRREQ